MSVPFEPQLDAGRLARDREGTLAPQRALAAICAAAGIPYLDLEPLLEARGGAGFFQDGVHFSAAGSDLAAAALLERLERDGLLP